MFRKVDLSIVILLWSADPDIKLHIESAQRLASELPRSSELVVVENGPMYPTVTWPTSVIRVASSANVGVPGGWNMGLAAASGRIICFLNQDARASSAGLLRLGALLDSAEDVFVVGVAGSTWDLDTMVHVSAVTSLDDKMVDCDVVSGYCFAVRAAELASLGGFDLALSPCGFEEVDLALRRLRTGAGRAVVVGGLDIRHEFGISSAPPWRNIEWVGGRTTLGLLHERNRAYMIAKARSYDGELIGTVDGKVPTRRVGIRALRRIATQTGLAVLVRSRRAAVGVKGQAQKRFTNRSLRQE